MGFKNFTYLDPEVRRRVKSASKILNSLDAGSKKRLLNYQKDLTRTRGSDPPLFDDRVRDVLLQYAYSPEEVLGEIDYLNHLVDKDGYHFSRDLKLYSSISDAMMRFSDNNYSSFRWNENYQKAKEFMINEFKQFNLIPLEYNSDDDIREVLPKLNTHAGFMYILSGKRSKGDNLEGLYKTYATEVNSAISDGSFNKPILIAFRTQGSGEYDDDGSRTGDCKHKTRVVSMIDVIWALGEFIFMSPLQRRLSIVEYYAGGFSDSEINTILRSWVADLECSQFISIDYSSYDQTISNWLMEDAYEIISYAFKMTDEQKRLWDVIVHDAVHKDFVLAEGILHSNKGIPSGLPSTQIIGSIINRLITMTYFFSINKKFKMMAMGDDNIIFSQTINIEDFSSYIKKNFGMIVNVDKCSSGTRGQDPKFLSRYWTVMGPWRHKFQLLSRMLFPERRRNYDRDDVSPEEVIYGMILTYSKGMGELIDVGRFIRDNPYLSENVLKRLGSRYIPGALSYRMEYTMVK